MSNVDVTFQHLTKAFQEQLNGATEALAITRAQNIAYEAKITELQAQIDGLKSGLKEMANKKEKKKANGKATSEPPTAPPKQEAIQH